MRLTIEATDTLTAIDGVPVRLWEGRTESGRPVWVFVHMITTADDGAQAELDRALREVPEPGEVAAERRRLANLLYRNAL